MLRKIAISGIVLSLALLSYFLFVHFYPREEEKNTSVIAHGGGTRETCPEAFERYNAIALESFEYISIEYVCGSRWGTCPNYKLTVYGDGKLEYQGNKDVLVMGKVTTQMPDELTKKVLKALIYSSFFEIPNRWGGNEKGCYRGLGSMDANIPAITIAASASNRAHEIKWLSGYQIPEQLRRLERDLVHLAAPDSWVGTPEEIAIKNRRGGGNGGFGISSKAYDGDRESQVQMAEHYLLTDNSKPNFVESYFWYSMAALHTPNNNDYVKEREFCKAHLKDQEIKAVEQRVIDLQNEIAGKQQ